MKTHSFMPLQNTVLKLQKTKYLIFCILMLLSKFSSAQPAVNHELQYDSYNAANTNGFPKTDVSKAASIEASVAVNTKLQKSFDAYFKNATDENWYMAGKNFHCSFYLNGLLTRTLFDKRGHLIYTITYGYEKDLPADTRTIIKTEYFDYNIVNAVNVKQDGRNIWVVQLSNSEKIITVRVENSEMELVQDFVKSN